MYSYSMALCNGKVYDRKRIGRVDELPEGLKEMLGDTGGGLGFVWLGKDVAGGQRKA